MEFKKMVAKAEEIKRRYDRAGFNKKWGHTEYAQGMVGDVGDLLQLVMAKNGYRRQDDLKNRLGHELSDILWAVIILAGEYGIDMEKTFMKNMDGLVGRIEKAKRKARK